MGKFRQWWAARRVTHPTLAVEAAYGFKGDESVRLTGTVEKL
jgi:hypothetical protein